MFNPHMLIYTNKLLLTYLSTCVSFDLYYFPIEFPLSTPQTKSIFIFKPVNTRIHISYFSIANDQERANKNQILICNQSLNIILVVARTRMSDSMPTRGYNLI